MIWLIEARKEVLMAINTSRYNFRRSDKPDETSELECSIRKRTGFSIRQLQVVVTDDGIILNGNASSYHAKQLVQEAVMEKTSFPIISNDIQVTVISVM